MLEHAYGVVLAGGRGERFWPWSTARRPKQLLALVGRKPLVAQAVQRLQSLVPHERTLVITHERHVKACQAWLPRLPARNVIGEPVARDTAAAITLAAAWIHRADPEAIMIILPADHVVRGLRAFRAIVRQAVALAAREDVLVTLGIPPTRAATGYGYIEVGRKVAGRGGRIGFHKVRRFVEKPGLREAQRYVRSGRFLWNSGMFIWSVRSFFQALEKHQPRLRRFAKEVTRAIGARNFAGLLKRAYLRLPSRSIDYALMEAAQNVCVGRARFDWDDVGSWAALLRHFPADSRGNVILGRGLAMESCGNLVCSRGRLTALLGVRDLIVVHAEKATLVCPKARAEDVKRLVQQMAKTGRFGWAL